MRIRRRLPIVLAVALVSFAIGVVVVLRKHAPPEPARLLPSADGFAYINLEWIRRANITGSLPSVAHDPDYEQFIRQTGFQPERDLDRAAFAIHYPSGNTSETRFSEVLVGNIDGQRLRAYLQKISSSRDSYESIDIYNIPLEGRTLRVAILGVDTVAASNHPDPEVIRGIISRSRKLASPFGGPSLLRQYYKHVPLASLAWMIFRTDSAGSITNRGASSALDPSFLFPTPTVIVGSARYLGAVHLRAEAFTGSEEAAERASDKIKTFVNVFASAEVSVAGASDAEVKQLFSTMKVERRKDRVLFTTGIPVSFIRKLVAEVPNEQGPNQAAPASSNKSKH